MFNEEDPVDLLGANPGVVSERLAETNWHIEPQGFSVQSVHQPEEQDQRD
jgi:hypothetical protein